MAVVDAGDVVKVGVYKERRSVARWAVNISWAAGRAAGRAKRDMGDYPYMEYMSTLSSIKVARLMTASFTRSHVTKSTTV